MVDYCLSFRTLQTHCQALQYQIITFYEHPVVGIGAELSACLAPNSPVPVTGAGVDPEAGALLVAVFLNPENRPELPAAGAEVAFVAPLPKREPPGAAGFAIIRVKLALVDKDIDSTLTSYRQSSRTRLWSQ